MNIRKQRGTIEWISQVELPSPVRFLQVYNPLFHQVLEDSASAITAPEENDTLQTELQMVDMNHVRKTMFPSTEYEQPVFIKYAPLLDPLKYMTGKYDLEPESKKQKMMNWTAAQAAKTQQGPTTKYHDLNNASYVDAFFCYLNSRLLHDYGFLNAIDFYGVYLGVQESFRINIIDDYDYLCKFHEFHEKLKQGDIILPSPCSPSSSDSETSSRDKKHTRVVKQTLKLVDLDPDQENALELGIIPLSPSASFLDPALSTKEMTLEYDAKQCTDIYESDSSQEENTDDSESDSDDSSDDSSLSQKRPKLPCIEKDESQSEDSEYETIDDDESSDSTDGEDMKIMATVKDFPVALICLEKCDGTLDSLFEQGVMNNDICMAVSFQIIITLAFYQRIFQFTHNDLHTHNIMYKKTDLDYLFYFYNGKRYRIPTFGYIIKIIDFGRSVYHYQGRKFTSDGFSPSGDAYSQYNTEPYFNARKKRIEENPSFDLCRLGCSIYDFIIDIDSPEAELDNFQKMVDRWCRDDRQKNILYKADGQERYPNFKLYKMIARAVHGHTPDQQLADFECFVISEEEAAQNPQWPWMELDPHPLNLVSLQD